MIKPIKLLLAIPHLGGGGAERVVAQLACHLSPDRFEIHIAVIADDALGAPTLPHWVTVHRLRTERVRNSALTFLSLVRALKPRIVFSGMAHLNFLVLLLKPLMPPQTRILIRQNTTASAVATKGLSRFLYRRLYPRADLIVCQTESMLNDLAQHFGIPAHKLAVLYNPIDFPVPQERAGANKPCHDASRTSPRTPVCLLAVARLSEEKGIDLLLEALPAVRKYYPSAELTILGTGPEEAKLRSLTEALGLAGAVEFIGHADPSAHYPATTLFVLSSRYEGMPNALLEAATAGLPIVATPCSGGVTDLLKDAPGAWVAKAIAADALACSICAALSELVVADARRFRHSFIAPFETSTAIAAYERVLQHQARSHVALIIPTLDQIGGAERQVLLLAKALAARQWQVSVIVLSGDAVAEQQSLDAAGVALLSLGMRKAWIDPRGWLRYLAWARLRKPNVVHSHLPHATYFARIARVVVRLFAAPTAIVDTIHTTHPGPINRQRAYRLTHWLSNQVTCVSGAVEQSVLGSRMASEVRIIPNGIELPPLPPSRPASETFRWIAVGRLAPVKDYPTLFRAFASLDSPAQLTIVGSGAEEAALFRLATDLKIADRLHFVGFQADVLPWLTAANAFVLSSLWEGLPISVLEASAANLPVVATDGAGTSSTMIPNQTGLLVPPGDSVALAEAMSKIMTMSPSQREAMGAAGRSFIESHFALDVVVDRWEMLYRELLNR